jgi:uncharacterized protein
MEQTNESNEFQAPIVHEDLETNSTTPPFSMANVLHQPHAFNYTSQFAILLGLTGIGFLVGGIVGIVYFVLATGSSYLHIQTAILDVRNANAIKIFQLISTGFAFFLPAVLYAVITQNQRPFKKLGFGKMPTITQIGIVSIMAVVGLFLSGSLAEINRLIPIPNTWQQSFKAMENAYNKQVMVIANIRNFTDYLTSLCVIAIAPAIFEEVLFRGALQQLLGNWLKNSHLAILITGLLFSAIHFSYYGFLPRFALGIILGYVFYFSKNIWLSVLLHFINNGIAVSQLYWLTLHNKLSLQSMEDNFPYWYGLPSAAILFVLFKQLKQTNCNQLIPAN